MILSNNGVSKVWRDSGFVYKSQPKHLTDNESFGLKVMQSSGYVPSFERIDIELIKMQDLGQSEPITNKVEFMSHLPLVLSSLKKAKIRHGDLTEYAVIVKDNKPFIVDFGESRHWDDPRLDKRREGDRFWLARTMAKLTNPRNKRSAEMFGYIYRALHGIGQTVLDVGCGYGDMSTFMCGVGYDVVALDKSKQVSIPEQVTFLETDLVSWLSQNKKTFDIALCLSVLPYVDTSKTLDLLRECADTVIVECQYKGDGPGQFTKEGFVNLLESKFASVDWIGFTEVKERKAVRDIWLCKGAKNK